MRGRDKPLSIRSGSSRAEVFKLSKQRASQLTVLNILEDRTVAIGSRKGPKVSRKKIMPHL